MTKIGPSTNERLLSIFFNASQGRQPELCFALCPIAIAIAITIAITNHDREQAKHANEAKCTWGIDGTTGVMTDMKDLGIWEPFTVKTQTYKTAVEVRNERRFKLRG